MVFSNAVFLFVFLPLTLLGYFLLRKTVLRNYWLLFVSLVFYLWGKPKYIVILIASMMINYFGARLVEWSKTQKLAKLALGSTVAANLLLLYYFKYFNFSVEVINDLFRANIDVKEVLLPVGISFFTFQGISYVIDVYRKDVPVQKNFAKFAMYISMFPQLVAGPIVRYKDIAKEIDNRSVSLDDFTDGIQRFIIGLSKKVIIADTLAVTADSIFSMSPSNNSIPVAWLGIICYSLQIFFDFAGYSDMAIGMGRMLGFHFIENFNYPYISKSITEFWRRWHISLSSFFRDYIYIPLGGNRKHTYLNVAIVFLLTGIWHGAAYTFVLWGIWHGIFNIAEKYLREKNKARGTREDSRLVVIGKHTYTLFVVMIGWILFRADSLSYAWQYTLSLFGLQQPGMPGFDVWWYLDRWTLLILGLAIVFATPAASKMRMIVKNRLHENGWMITKYVTLLALLFLCVLRVASNTYSAFIYFQF